MHALKRTFEFRNPAQAAAFHDVVSLYGRGILFGNVVIFEASLDFALWRKIVNLARIISREQVPDIRLVSSRAGLRLFREAEGVQR